MAVNSLQREQSAQARHKTKSMVMDADLCAHKCGAYLLLLCAVIVALWSAGCASRHVEPAEVDSIAAEAASTPDLQLVAELPDEVNLPIVVAPGPTASTPRASTKSRGYLTTPQELKVIAEKAKQGIEPYADAMTAVVVEANKAWDYDLDKNQTCGSSDKPKWNDDDEGVSRLYARALAYHLTGEERYAAEVKAILERIMSKVLTIDIDEQQCRLNFGWGTPELVASADLIEDYWLDQNCQGPIGTLYSDKRIGDGPCKTLFQNWLVKNPYYIVSLSAANSNSNWGAAATNTTAYIADYLWDRPDVTLLHRHPPQLNGGQDMPLTPSKAYAYANQLMFDRMNGYSISYGGSTSCDFLSGPQQSDQWKPVKSQITEGGIIPEDARREQYCNVPEYANETYQNYPQIHLGNNIQQCELMLRRGDRSCFDNVDNSNIPKFNFIGPDGEPKVTSLYPGRGSIERAIDAIIIDANTPWEHDAALEIAYRYYYSYAKLPGFDRWFEQLDRRPVGCSQNVCFTTLTHGFAPGEVPALPPTAPPP